MPNRPLAEPHGDIASDSHANGKNHVKVVVRKLAFDAPRTLLSNLQKLFASCLAHKFTVTVDLVDMVGDILTTCLKQLLICSAANQTSSPSNRTLTFETPLSS